MGDPGDYVERIKAFPPDWWKMESVACTLAKCFAQHLVAIEVAFLSEGTPAHDFYTGFLLRWGPLDLWVTAGHVVARIRELLANPKVQILRAGLLDGYETEDAAAVPVALGDLPLFSAEPEFDFGAAGLREAYVAPILANPRFRPLTPAVWHNHERAQPEGYYIVGLPQEWVQVREVGTRTGELLSKATMGIACVPVERDPAPTSEQGEFWGHPGAFYGRLCPVHNDDGSPLKRIEGMSGGPVFSIERTQDGQFRYYLFGIQSAWLPCSRVIRAAPISQVADLIRQAMAYMHDHLGESDSADRDGGCG
jgi:hypothetical protein